MKKCDEVMTKNPVCCLPNDKVAKVAQEMRVSQPKKTAAMVKGISRSNAK